MKTRQLMISNVLAYNSVLSKTSLEQMSDEELINNCHPSDRLSFERMLKKEQEDMEHQKTD